MFYLPLGQFDLDVQVAQTILPIIENTFKIKCFSDHVTCWHYDDKIRQFYLLNAWNFPVIKTWVFWDKKSAADWIETAPFPLVFKLKGGAGSSNVVLIIKKNDAKRIIKRIFSNKGILSQKIPVRDNVSFLSKTRLYNIRRFIALKRGRLGPGGSNPYWQI